MYLFIKTLQLKVCIVLPDPEGRPIRRFVGRSAGQIRCPLAIPKPSIPKGLRLGAKLALGLGDNLPWG